MATTDALPAILFLQALGRQRGAGRQPGRGSGAQPGQGGELVGLFHRDRTVRPAGRRAQSQLPEDPRGNSLGQTRTQVVPDLHAERLQRFGGGTLVSRRLAQRLRQLHREIAHGDRRLLDSAHGGKCACRQQRSDQHDKGRPLRDHKAPSSQVIDALFLTGDGLN